MQKQYLDHIQKLTSIGIALSAEKDRDKLLEKILINAMELTNADGGTLYLVTKDEALKFKILLNQSLNLKLSDLETSSIAPVVIHDKKGRPNLKNIVSYCYIQNKTICIDDAYHVEGFVFSGMKKVDLKFGYHSKSFLAIPLRNHENKIIGVLQLINALDNDNKKVITFSDEKIKLAESLASQAAITLTQNELIEAQKNLFEALIKLIAKAIDKKSKYTSQHCERVPVIAQMIAEAAVNAKDGYFKDFHLTKEQFEELRVAAWLHDCGKIVTPVHIVDKATKLEAISDRIEVIDLRLENILKDLKITYLERLGECSVSQKKILKKEYLSTCQEIKATRQFLHKVNLGGEFLTEEDKQKIRQLGKKTFLFEEKLEPLLSDRDIENLTVSRGTLNDADREIINQHVSITHEMLSLLPYPEYLKNVTKIASVHHERVDGKGYPNHLSGEEIPIQGRMLAIADVFEALTAADRPYKPAKTLKETIDIMQELKRSGHIDPNLFDLFLDKKIYLHYAREYLLPQQLDFD